jgi:hypothetical protein
VAPRYDGTWAKIEIVINGSVYDRKFNLVLRLEGQHGLTRPRNLLQSRLEAFWKPILEAPCG